MSPVTLCFTTLAPMILDVLSIFLLGRLRKLEGRTLFVYPLSGLGAFARSFGMHVRFPRSDMTMYLGIGIYRNDMYSK